MKHTKAIKATLLAVLMLCALFAFAACGQSGDADYCVTVVDALGNPCTEGFAVKFMQDGQQKAMQTPNEKGECLKTLPRGEYSVELVFTGDSDYHYDSTQLTLTADKHQLQVTVFFTAPEEATELYVGGDTYQAYTVKVGATQVTLDGEKRSYFLFYPEQDGTYEFSVIGSDAAIGYYGAPHFVQEYSAVEVVDNKVSVSVRDDNLASGNFALVIGLDPAQGDTMLAIERIGDPAWSYADEPWVIYQKTAQLKQYTLPAGATIRDFDLTASTDTYKLVYNEQDGFYHLDSADGALVLVRLGKNNEGAMYMDPFETVLEHTGVLKYFFDENDEFVKKENYSDCLTEYIAVMDEATGLYPLTEDLKYIIQSAGDHSGWFRAGENTYLFVNEEGDSLPGINNDIAWLFMCCYIG